MNFVIEKDGHMFYAMPDGAEYWKVVSADDGATSGDLEIQVYTRDNVNENGTFELGNGSKETDVVFYDALSDTYNFEIKEGTVNIYVYNDMVLSNEYVTPARSAIDIYPNATLNLYLEEESTVTVNSSLGESAQGNTPGKGGFAGVHVPSTDDGAATFNLYGDGTLVAVGGNAGNGGTSAVSNVGSSGGGRSRSWHRRKRRRWRTRCKSLCYICNWRYGRTWRGLWYN